MKRILWNKRDEDIDEIVFTDVAMVHVEQMSDSEYWIAIDLPDGGHWAGCFNSRSKMRFTEHEQLDFKWDEDREHKT